MLTPTRTFECELFLAAIYLQGILLSSGVGRHPVRRNVRIVGCVTAAWSLLYVVGESPDPLRHFALLGLLVHQSTTFALLLRKTVHHTRTTVLLVAVMQCILYAFGIGWTVWSRHLPSKVWYLALAATGAWWGLTHLQPRRGGQALEEESDEEEDDTTQALATPCAPSAPPDAFHLA